MNKVTIFAIFLLLVSMQSAFADMYRYKNAKGQLVLSNQIPSDQVRLGYEILGDDGKVKQVIEPDLTPEERAAKLLAKQQADHDKYLLEQYSTTDEVDAARDRQVEQLNSAAAITQSNIRNLKERKDKLQQQAAITERNGGKVNQQVRDDIQQIDYHIGIEQKRLEDQNKVKQTTINIFAQDKIRLAQLRKITETPSLIPTR
jgi:hypothetical protein